MAGGSESHTEPVMDRLTEIGIRMAMLVRRKCAAAEEWQLADQELKELEEEIRTASTGQLYGAAQAARLRDDSSEETRVLYLTTSEPKTYGRSGAADSTAVINGAVTPYDSVSGL